MRQAIYTPRVSVDMLLRTPDQRNKCVCTKIPYRGFEVSISMDSSHGDGDLRRSDILVDNAAGENVTGVLFPEFKKHGVMPASAESLLEVFGAIDLAVRKSGQDGVVLN